MSHVDPREILGSYLTALLGWQGAGVPIGGPPGHTPAQRQLYGTMLFADLSGCTRMTEALTEDGDFAPERINRVLNHHIGSVVGAVHAAGGDVVTFAGDAVLACWPADDGSPRALATTAAAAARCGLDIIVRQRHLAPIPGLPRLQVRVGIELGPVQLHHLGAAEVRRVLLVTGASVEGATDACAQAEPGELRAGPNARKILAGHLRPGAHPDSIADLSPRVRALPLPVAPQLRWDPTFSCYLPSTVLHRVRGHQGSWMSELRTISAVFVRLPDLRAGAHPERMDQVFEAVWRPIRRHGGIVNKLNIDEKGATVLAVFGLPPEVHEDGAARACLAGLDIVAAMATVDGEAQVGIATGRAFCGEVGAVDRREYTVIGDAVNTAARLMQAAAKRSDGAGAPPVLVDEETGVRASGHIGMEDLGALQLKGKRDGVSVFRPQRQQAPAHSRRVRLVARDHVRQRVDGVVQVLMRTGRGGAMLIAGGAGLGKTALLGALHPAIEAAGSLVVRTRADAFQATKAGASFAPVIAAILDENDATDAIFDTFSDEDRGILGTLRALLPAALHLPPAPPPSGLEARALRARQVEVLVSLLARGAAARPTTVLLDDAHHLDMLSLDLVSALATGQTPLLVVLTSRPPPDAPDHIWSRLRRIPDPLPLATLDRSEQDRVAADRLGIGRHDLPRDLGALLWQRAGGNPLFLTALIDDLLRRGLVRTGGGHCVLDRAALRRDGAGLPVTLEAMLLTRLDRLSTAAQFTCKVAAVLGTRFRLSELLGTHPLVSEPDRIRADLAEMARMRVAEPETGTQEETWQFQHVLVRDAIYDILPKAQRGALHSRAAQVLTQNAASLGRRTDWRAIADHWQAAGEWAAATPALLRAADTAAREGRNAEAIEIIGDLDRLILGARITLAPAEAQARHQVLGAAHLASAAVDKARRHLRALLSLLDDRTTGPLRWPRLWLLAAGLRARLPWARPAGSGESLRARIQAHLRLAWLEHRHGTGPLALQHAMRAMVLADGSPQAPGAAALVDRLLATQGRQLPARWRPAPTDSWHVEVTLAANAFARASDQSELSLAMDRLRGLVAQPAARRQSLARDQLLVLVSIVHILRAEPYRILDELHTAGHRARSASADDTGSVGSATVEAVRTIGLATCGTSWTLGNTALLEAQLETDHGPAFRALLHTALARAAWHQSRFEAAGHHIGPALAAWEEAPASPEQVLPAVVLADTVLAWLRRAQDEGSPIERDAATFAGEAVHRTLTQLAERLPLARFVLLDFEAGLHGVLGHRLRARWSHRRATAAAVHLGLSRERPPVVALAPPPERSPAVPPGARASSPAAATSDAPPPAGRLRFLG